MERMNGAIRYLDARLDQAERDNKKLEEENKKLKDKQKILDKENCELIDENVRLKAKIDFYEKIYSSNYNGNTTLNGKYKLSEQHPNVGDM